MFLTCMIQDLRRCNRLQDPLSIIPYLGMPICTIGLSHVVAAVAKVPPCDTKQLSILHCVPAAKVFQAIQGHWLTACLGVLMDLKIPEILSSQQQPVEFKQVTYIPWLIPNIRSACLQEPLHTLAVWAPT